MAVVLGSCSVHVYCHYLKCPDLYDKVYDYFILITQTNVLQSIMEKKKKKGNYQSLLTQENKQTIAYVFYRLCRHCMRWCARGTQAREVSKETNQQSKQGFPALTVCAALVRPNSDPKRYLLLSLIHQDKLNNMPKVTQLIWRSEHSSTEIWTEVYPIPKSAISCLLPYSSLSLSIYIFTWLYKAASLGGNAEDRGVSELKGTDAVMDGRKRPWTI